MSGDLQLIDMPMDILRLNSTDREAYGKRSICGVHATAVITGHTFSKTWKTFASIHSPRWRGRLANIKIVKGMKDLGAELQSCNSNEFIQLHRRPLIQVVTALTMTQEPGAVFVIFIRGHVVVVQDNKVVDQSGVWDIKEYPGKNRLMLYILQVTNANQMLAKRQHYYNEESSEDMSENVIKQPTKIERAQPIVRAKIAAGLKRKEILAILVEEVDTTWDSASMMYHKIKKQMENDTNKQAALGTV